ncbi:MAG TPA: family 43 glycosylhydrolase [Acidimicrobiales bacterium]|nr:family 43 glycosylhydrolase [Acidimicrobiales bacterium]
MPRSRPNPAGAALQRSASSLTVATPGAPAFDGDAPDADVVTSGSTYYAFTTGTALGNHIQVLVDTSGSSTSGWRSTTGQNYGSSALPVVPSWEQVDTQTSPGVFYWNGHWIMYYDAAQSGHAGNTGYDCLSVATATTLAPTRAVFSDTSTGPLVCDAALGGAIDPTPFVDTKTGIAYLVWSRERYVI